MADNLKAFQHQAAAGGAMVSALHDHRVLGAAAGVSGPMPEHVVRPAGLPALTAVVKAATQHRVPLWIVWNAAGNALQVSAAPGRPVLLDLSRMDQIVDLDTKFGFALVEPGVSYDMLAKAVAAKGGQYWVDSARNGGDSIAGNIIDKSFGYTPYGDRVMMQCGMEVMLSDGDLVRTGMGAMPKGTTWQSFKWGFGPIADGMFMQSMLAVPTKMGVWLCQQPPRYKPFAVRASSDSAYAAVIDFFTGLRVNQLVANTVVATDGDSEKALLGGQNIASWNVYGALYGIPKNVDFLWNMVNGAVGKISGAQLEDLEAATTEPRVLLMSGKPAPSWQQFEKQHAGRYLRLVFALPIDGQQSLDFVNQTKQAVAGAGFEVAIEQAMAWRSLLPEVLISFPAGKEHEAVACGASLVQKWAGQGVGVVRASPALMPASMATYSNGALQSLTSKLTKAVAA